MLDTIQIMQYRARANVPRAKAELENRLLDRLELPLLGIHNEKLYLTAVSHLEQKATELRIIYDQLPKRRNISFWIHMLPQPLKVPEQRWKRSGKASKPRLQRMTGWW